MPHCKGETWCRQDAAKCRSWASEGWKVISTWEAATGCSIASGLMHILLYCSFKIATCTAHSQHRQIPFSCSPPRTPTVHILHHIPATRFQHLILPCILFRMAAVTSVVSGSVAAAPASATRLSWSAASAAAPAQFAPVRNVNLSGSRVVAVNATYSEVCVDELQVLATNFLKPLKITRRVM